MSVALHNKVGMAIETRVATVNVRREFQSVTSSVLQNINGWKFDLIDQLVTLEVYFCWRKSEEMETRTKRQI